MTYSVADHWLLFENSGIISLPLWLRHWLLAYFVFRTFENQPVEVFTCSWDIRKESSIKIQKREAFTLFPYLTSSNHWFATIICIKYMNWLLLNFPPSGMYFNSVYSYKQLSLTNFVQLSFDVFMHTYTWVHMYAYIWIGLWCKLNEYYTIFKAKAQQNSSV